MPCNQYDALPFPLSTIPDPEENVTLSDLRDAALPLIRSVCCALHAFSAAAESDIVREDLPHALGGLAGQAEICRDLIDRATRDQ